MNETELERALDAYVVPFRDEPEEWGDVLRRAQRRRRFPRRRVVVAVLVAVAVLGATPALAVLLLSRPPRLPDGADRSRVQAVLDPASGRIMAQIAPWRGYDGVCYLVPGVRAGCIHRTPRSTVILSPPRTGITFYARIVSAWVLRGSGHWQKVPFRRFGPPLDVAFFFPPSAPDIHELQLRDAHGHVVGDAQY